jgi:uncharacterized protein (DUF1499 family)
VGTVANTSDLTVAFATGNHRLAPCPESSNCVSSVDPLDEHYIAPLRYTGNKTAAYQRLVNLIASQQRTRIVIKEPDYLKAEFRSAILRFVDDVEFLFSAGQPVIDVRSASRVGYYDFGVNRKRIEDLRSRWDQDLGY